MIKESRLNFIFILVVAFASYMAFNQKSANIDGGTPYSCNTEDITNMYADYIQKWKQEVNIAFNEAEEEIIDIDTPDIVGPDPDPKNVFVVDRDGSNKAMVIKQNALIMEQGWVIL